MEGGDDDGIGAVAAAAMATGSGAATTTGSGTEATRRRNGSAAAARDKWERLGKFDNPRLICENLLSRLDPHPPTPPPTKNTPAAVQREERRWNIVKFMKPGKAVILLQGRYTGKKAMIVRVYEEGTRDHPYGHCLVTGLAKYPKKVIRKDSAKKTTQESRVKMEYEAGLVVSGPMTQLEAEIWIQNMENHFLSNLISRKYEVEHALEYFTQSAAIWWKMHHSMQGFSGAETWDEFKDTLLRSRLIQKCYDNPKENTCACKICGEIGHTQEEHKDGCTHCEENHPAEECPSSQVTCFLCEGTTHYPAQCHIYPKVQQVVRQQQDAVKETLKKKILEEPVMNENIEDPDGQDVDLKEVVSVAPDSLTTKYKKLTATKSAKAKLEERFKISKSMWFFTKLCMIRHDST
ncbi:60S ribosomal protein L27 [Hordeum vulgare]|nr:60S ribosomal protein L27 [Hordeum vulgare]